MATPNAEVGAVPPPVAMSWAVVTGAASRGGAAIARVLHARGLSVVVHHSPRSQLAAVALAAELNAQRAESARTWCADFAQPALAVPDWLLTLAPGVLVCNASTFAPSAVGDAAQAQLDWQVHVGAHAAILAALLPAELSPANPPANPPALRSVVSVTDIHVERPPRGHVWYVASKAALQALTMALAVEWAPQVRFNVVQPGTLPMPADWTDAERALRIAASIPMRRLGTFDELARAVAWLALDADYVTGQVLAVDGGRSRYMV